MLAKHVVALVRRDMAEIIPTTVFEHEVEILKSIHGEDSISIADELPDSPLVEIDAADEFGRLRANYGTNETGQPHVERVFGISHRGLEAYAHKPAKAAKAAKADAQDGKADE